MKKQKKLDLEDELAICQMRCAEMIFAGGGMDLDVFLNECGLNDKHYIKLAKKEGIQDFVIDEMERMK